MKKLVIVLLVVLGTLAAFAVPGHAQIPGEVIVDNDVAITDNGVFGKVVVDNAEVEDTAAVHGFVTATPDHFGASACYFIPPEPDPGDPDAQEVGCFGGGVTNPIEI